MGLAGKEKRIQALFCELSLADQSIAPRFEELWHRAQMTRPQPAHRFSLSVVVIASSVAIAAICSLMLWSQYRSVEWIPAVVLNIGPAATTPRRQSPGNVIVAGPRKTRKPAGPTKTETADIHGAIMLSSWQSPTGIFMESYAGGVVKSLPQLNQSVRELESFLPRSEVKESKQ